MRILTEGQHLDPVFRQCAFMRITRLILFNARGTKSPSILQGLTCLSNCRANAIERGAMPAAGAQSLVQINRMRGALPGALVPGTGRKEWVSGRLYFQTGISQWRFERHATVINESWV
jgi:hypothetical protein